MKIKGNLKPILAQKPKETVSSVGNQWNLSELYAQLDALGTDLIDTVNFKLEELETRIQDQLDKVVDTTKVLEDTQNEIVDYVNNVKQGPPGESPDAEKILQNVLDRIPVRDEQQMVYKITQNVMQYAPSEERIIARVMAQTPRVDEKALEQRILAKVPKPKTSLKVIQEKFEIDPMSVIDKIMTLPEDKFKIKSSQIDGLQQTMAAFHNQLGRGYLHGGGDTVQAGSNITITNSAGGKKIISSTAGPVSTAKELFSVSSLTTNVTLAHTPISSAVTTVSYNGQLIYFGRDWTLAGAVVTFLFTLDDSSHAEVVYNY